MMSEFDGSLIGTIAGLVCSRACTWLKCRLNYDDSLDMFGVHGIGGMTGILLAGVFATASTWRTTGLLEGSPYRLLIQIYGVAVTLARSAGVTYLLPKTGQRLGAAACIPAAGAGRPGYFTTWRGIAVNSLSKYRSTALAVSMIMSKYLS
jgi:hypothetical protein